MEEVPLPPSIWREHFTKWVAVIAVLHFVLGIAYTVVLPYRTPAVSYGVFLPDVGAPDERAHAQVISELLTKGQYPYFDSTNKRKLKDGYEAHQPPVYYAVTAGVLKFLGSPSVESQFFGTIARTLNCAFGAANVAGCAFLVWWLLAGTKLHRARLALATATLVALVPMNLAVSASINNDTLLFAFCTWAWALAALSRSKSNPWLTLLSCGFLLGLAVLTKFSGLLAIPVSVLIAFWPPHFKSRLVPAGALVCVAVALATPWLLRNMNLYGEPFMTRHFESAFTPNPRIHVTDFEHFYRWTTLLTDDTAESATGVFGYYDIHYGPVVIQLAAWAALFIATIGIVNAWHTKQSWLLVIGAVCFTLFLAAYGAFNLLYFQPQARYLFPALPWIALLVAFGLQKLNPRVTAAYLGLYLVLNICTLPWLKFEFWLRTNPDERAYIAVPFSQRHLFPPPRSMDKTHP